VKSCVQDSLHFLIWEPLFIFTVNRWRDQPMIFFSKILMHLNRNFNDFGGYITAAVCKTTIVILYAYSHIFARIHRQLQRSTQFPDEYCFRRISKWEGDQKSCFYIFLFHRPQIRYYWTFVLRWGRLVISL